MTKEKCDRCGSFLGTESKKTKQKFCVVVIVKGNFNYIEIKDFLLKVGISHFS